MLTTVPMFDKLPVYNALTILVFILFSLCECHRNGEKRLTPQKLDSMFEKYMAAVKRLSAFPDDFPNHQIELHLDIAGDAAPQKPTRVRYINLREPAPQLVHSNGKKTEDSQKLRSGSPNETDPELQPVLMRDLKNAMRELEKKIRENTNSKLGADEKMKLILQLLKKGKVVGTGVQKPPDDNSLSWIRIKIPQ